MTTLKKKGAEGEPAEVQGAGCSEGRAESAAAEGAGAPEPCKGDGGEGGEVRPGRAASRRAVF